MKIRSARTTAILALLCLVGGCINLEDIRSTDPVREAAFEGSFEKVAQCIQTWLGGKVGRDPFRAEISVYDSVKSFKSQGVSHYAMTVIQTGENQGIVEWRKLPEEQAAQAELRELLLEKIHELPETHRNVLLLRDIEDMDTEETARILELTPGAVKTRLHRARLALRGLMEPHLRRTEP